MKKFIVAALLAAVAMPALANSKAEVKSFVKSVHAKEVNAVTLDCVVAKMGLIVGDTGKTVLMFENGGVEIESARSESKGALFLTYTNDGGTVRFKLDGKTGTAYTSTETPAGGKYGPLPCTTVED